MQNRKKVFSLDSTGYLGFGIVFIIVALSIISPNPLTWGLLYTLAGLSLLGFLALILRAKRYPCYLTSPKDENAFLQSCKLIIGQGLIFGITLLFFHQMTHQTALNPRLQTLDATTLFNLFKTQAFIIGFCPWLLYAVLGIGLPYLSQERRISPLFKRVIFSEFSKQPASFCYQFISVTINTVSLFPIVLLMGFSFIWIGDTLNHYFEFPSLYSYPIRSAFILALLLLVFRKSNQKFAQWMIKKNMSLGSMSITYILLLVLALLWIHGLGSAFTLGVENTKIKSYFAGNLSLESQTNRLTLLIWGWHVVLIPWMTSFIARHSLGKSILVACLIAMIFPGMMFLWIIPHVSLDMWQSFLEVLAQPQSQRIVALLMLIFLYQSLKGIHNTADLALGYLSPIYKRQGRPLTSIWYIIGLFLSAYLLCVFMLGWLPTQVILTVGAIGIMLVVLGFVHALMFNNDIVSSEVVIPSS